MCGEFQLSDVIIIQGFLCSCDRNKSSKCYREGYTGSRGSVGRTSCASKLFGGFAKQNLLVILEQNGSHALATVFKQTEGEEGVGVGGGQCRRKVETICGNLFSMCVNLKELFLGSLWSEQNGTKHS
jgi:hypothetical protein